MHRSAGRTGPSPPTPATSAPAAARPRHQRHATRYAGICPGDTDDRRTSQRLLLLKLPFRPQRPTPESSGVPVPPATSGPIGVPASGTAIYLSEWSVGVPTSMLAGQANFAITNIGTIQHELLVFKTDLPSGLNPSRQ